MVKSKCLQNVSVLFQFANIFKHTQKIASLRRIIIYFPKLHNKLRINANFCLELSN